MSATILDGKAIAEKLRAELAEQIAELSRPPRLVAIMAGGDEGTDSYARIQRRTAELLEEVRGLLTSLRGLAGSIRTMSTRKTTSVN